MTATWVELAQTLIAFVAFALFLLPPGFLAGHALNVYGMRERSRAEQGLWALVLSVPLALLLAEGLGRVLPGAVVVGVFWALAAGAIGVWVAGRRAARAEAPAGTRLALIAAGLFVAYVALATLDVQVGTRLFAPTLVNDWSVRLPMVAAAEHGRVPPLNPLSAVGGPPAHLRYYYFWYVLCAEPARMLHLPTHAVLSASAAWSGLALVALALLCLRYMAGVRGFGRRRVGLLLVVFLVIGLDAIHGIAGLFGKNPHPQPDIEWWRPDRTPGFVTTALNSPHHLAGIVCCMAAVLLVLECCRGWDGAEQRGDGVSARSWRAPAGRALVAGCAFAACAGTSTFQVFIFVSVCVLLGLDLLRRRELRAVAVLLGAGVVAWAMAHPYLRELRGGSSAAHGFAAFAVRSSAGAYGFMRAHHLFQSRPAVAWVARSVYEAGYDFLELGFFFFVLLDRVRRELIPALQGRGQMSAGQRALWVVLAGGGVNALLLSSKLTQSANDLGMHAGMLVRFVLVIWSVPFLERVFAREGLGEPRVRGVFRWAALLCLGLGLVAEAENLVMERFFFPMMEARVLRGPIPELTADRLSYRMADMRAAWRWAGEHLPVDAHVQENPGGAMQPAFALFSKRQIVAEDTGCGTAFGGDPNRCGPLVRQLRQLYGGFPGEERDEAINHEAPPPRPARVADAADLARVCAANGLQYVFVDETDPAWNEQESWVWALAPVFADGTVRVYRCGGA